MKRLVMLGGLALACVAASPRAIHAQVVVVSNGDVGDVTIDTAAIGALNRMGAYLRTLKAMQIRADVTTEEVLEDGQKIQLTNRVELVAERPNRLRAELTSDRKHRVFLYDGSTFTLFAPRQNFYATVDAPATINELSKVLEDKYGLDLPLVDLFRFGTPDAELRITSARDIGPSTVDGVTCQHYAFRQAGVDWQVWIQNGDYPLPRKVVVTTLTDEARPQHAAQYTWNLAPSFNADAFLFVVPKDAKKVALAEVRTAGTGKPGGDGR